MCLYCIGKVSNCSIKSCGRSSSALEGTKLLHAYFQCVYIVSAKYQIVPSKAVVGVDRPMMAPSMHIQKPN